MKIFNLFAFVIISILLVSCGDQKHIQPSRRNQGDHSSTENPNTPSSNSQNKSKDQSKEDPSAATVDLLDCSFRLANIQCLKKYKEVEPDPILPVYSEYFTLGKLEKMWKVKGQKTVSDQIEELARTDQTDAGKIDDLTKSLNDDLNSARAKKIEVADQMVQKEDELEDQLKKGLISKDEYKKEHLKLVKETNQMIKDLDQQIQKLRDEINNEDDLLDKMDELDNRASFYLNLDTAIREAKQFTPLRSFTITFYKGFPFLSYDFHFGLGDMVCSPDRSFLYDDEHTNLSEVQRLKASTTLVSPLHLQFYSSELTRYEDPCNHYLPNPSRNKNGVLIYGTEKFDNTISISVRKPLELQIVMESKDSNRVADVCGKDADHFRMTFSSQYLSESF